MTEMPDSPFEPVDDAGESMGGETMDDGTDMAGGGGGPMDRLFDGNAPGPAVGELKADYEMPQWLAVTSRGIMRVATGDGVPPIAEIVIGSLMGMMGSDMDFMGGGDDSDDSGSSGDVQATSGAPEGVDL